MISERLKQTKRGFTVKASLWYTVSNILARGLGVLFTPIFTRLLSPAEYGIYPLYISWMGIFTVMGSFELPGNVMYRTLSKFKGEEHSVLSSALGIEIALSITLATVYIIFRNAINALTNLSTTLTLLLIFQVLINSVTGIFFSYKRYSYDYKHPSLVNALNGIVTPLLALLLIISGMGGFSRVLSPLLSSIVFAIPMIFSILKRDKSMFSREKWHYFFKLALPMLIHYISLSIIAGGDKIIISHLMDDAAIGKYSAAYSVGFMMSLVTNGISLALSPWILRCLGEGEGKIKHRISFILDGIVTLTLLFFAIAPEIFGFILPEEYNDAFAVIYPISVSAVILFLSGIFVTVLLHYEKPFKITRNSFISMLLFLLFASILIREYGYIGGAFATLTGYLFMLLFNLISARREHGESLVSTANFLKNGGMILLFGTLFYLTRYTPVSRILLAGAVILIYLPKLIKRI